MPAESIKWHEECLSNSEWYLKNLEEELDRLIQKVKKCQEDNHRYRAQIEKAKLLGKIGFDRDRFCRWRPEK